MSESTPEGTHQQAEPSVWWELPTTNLAESAAFYDAVFGWRTEPFGEGYLILYLGERMIGGLFEVAEGSIGDGARVTFDVVDLEATLARVQGEGGTVVTERAEIGGDMGWWATFRDPVGLLVGVSTSNPA